ncbi:MAG TPA: hypothetical protein VH371_04130 [Candidatus Limnocylindrales bacterium]|jgi:hypothetical protein
MRKIHLVRSLRFLVAGPLVVALLATLALAQVAAAAEAPITLASASDGRTLKLGDIASDDFLVVAFQQRNLSYIRWSMNEGHSFASKFALHDGLPAKDPRVATCNDSIFAVSSWPGATPEVGLFYRNFVTGDVGNYSLGAGSMADVSCFGDIGAVTWVNAGHLWLAARTSDVSDCSGPCPTLTLDLGTGDFTSPPRITGDYAGFSVAWLTSGLTVQHFDYDSGSGDNFTLTPKPSLTLMAGKGVSDPLISGLGERLVVAYQRAGRTHIRISDDQASSFGPRIVVPGPCTSCANGGPRPMSVSISGAHILVEVSRAAGSPLAYAMNGFLTGDSGATWTKVSTRAGGSQSGIIIEGATYAEVWDHDFSSKANQYIRYQGDHL